MDVNFTELFNEANIYGSDVNFTVLYSLMRQTQFNCTNKEYISLYGQISPYGHKFHCMDVNFTVLSSKIVLLI